MDGWLWLVGMELDGCALKNFGQLLEHLHFLVPNMGIGATGAGCWRALKSSVAATAEFSAKNWNGIVELCGNNSTVSVWTTAHVYRRYMP